MTNIFPWQQQLWQHLVSRESADQLPHALLIKGIEGVGKHVFAKSFAEFLLCTNNTGKQERCGGCPSCMLLDADNHPDLIVLSSEDPGKALKIDQVRALNERLTNTSHQGGYKVAIIESAELLNVAAANALLKTLEEPAVRTIIILITAYPAMLPATIRSRCQVVTMHPPNYSLAVEWLSKEAPDYDASLLLALAENAPLKSLSLIDDGLLSQRQDFFDSLDDLMLGKVSSVQMAKQCVKWGLDNLLVTLINIVSDLIKIKFGIDDGFVNRDQLEQLKVFATKVNLNKLLAYKDHLYKIRGHLSNKINLNQQLTIENLIITWLQMF